MSLQRSRNGLLAGGDRYRPLRAFAQGGTYWDAEPQRLLRAGALGEFLPKVEWVEETHGRSARFHCGDAGRDRLGKSRPLGSAGVPPDQIARLRQGLVELYRKAMDSDTQPQNRSFIAEFCLPDIARAPELFRVTGPFWNRRLHILWGCETAPGASLPALRALRKLPVDRAFVRKRKAAAAGAILLVMGFLGAIAWFARSASERVSIPRDSALVAARAEPRRAPEPTRTGHEEAKRGLVDNETPAAELPLAPIVGPRPSTNSQLSRPTSAPALNHPGEMLVADWSLFGWLDFATGGEAPPLRPDRVDSSPSIEEQNRRRLSISPHDALNSVELPGGKPAAAGGSAVAPAPFPPFVDGRDTDPSSRSRTNNRRPIPPSRLEHGAERLMDRGR